MVEPTPTHIWKICNRQIGECFPQFSGWKEKTLKITTYTMELDIKNGQIGTLVCFQAVLTIASQGSGQRKNGTESEYSSHRLYIDLFFDSWTHALWFESNALCKRFWRNKRFRLCLGIPNQVQVRGWSHLSHNDKQSLAKVRHVTLLQANFLIIFLSTQKSSVSRYGSPFKEKVRRVGDHDDDDHHDADEDEDDWRNLPPHPQVCLKQNSPTPSAPVSMMPAVSANTALHSTTRPQVTRPGAFTLLNNLKFSYGE